MRIRTKELRMVRAGDLVRHEENPYRHSTAQRSALQSAVDQVGFVGAVDAVELEDGRLQIVDGELRSTLDPDAMIPVAIADLTPEEARIILATKNPIARMVETDTAALARLKETAQGAGETLKRLLQATQKPSMLTESATTRSGVAAASAKPAAEQERWPLAVVLNTADYRRWKAVKEGLGVKDDGKAFAACLDRMEDSGD